MVAATSVNAVRVGATEVSGLANWNLISSTKIQRFSLLSIKVIFSSVPIKAVSKFINPLVASNSSFPDNELTS